jgi:Tfp pilus assembly protein PilN
MIQINLLPGPKKKKKGGGGAGFEMPNFGEMFAKVKDPLLLVAVGSWVVVGGGLGGVYVWRERTISGTAADSARVAKEEKRYSNLIAQKKKTDSLRVKVENEIIEIRTIDDDRYVWPHTLEEVTKALPDYTWLVNIEFLKVQEPADTGHHAPPPIKFQIEGRTSDIEAYTRFVRQLSTSPWLTNIVVGAAQTVVESDRPVTAFTITAEFHQADVAYRRTVPVRETVR